MRRKLLTLLGAGVLVGALAVPSLVLAGGNPANKLKAHMTGAQIVPSGQGAPSGDGNAQVTLRPAKNKICFRVTYKSIGSTKGLNAGIYTGKKGQNGDLYEKLFTGDKPSPVEGCAKNVSNAHLKALRQNPSSFHVNVKTDKYPKYGAIRGQLKPRS
jgi:hypothetical protein